MGGCKNGPFLNAGCIMYSISIVYFTFYLFGGGGAYAPKAPPLPTGLHHYLFTARHYASAVYAVVVCSSVCLSVCLSVRLLVISRCCIEATGRIELVFAS